MYIHIPLSKHHLERLKQLLLNEKYQPLRSVVLTSLIKYIEATPFFFQEDDVTLYGLLSELAQTADFRQNAGQYAKILGPTIVFQLGILYPQFSKMTFDYFCENMQYNTLVLYEKSVKLAVMIESNATTNPLQAEPASEQDLFFYASVLQTTHGTILPEDYCLKTIRSFIKTAQNNPASTIPPLLPPPMAITPPPTPQNVGRFYLALIQRWVREEDFPAFSIQPVFLSGNTNLRACAEGHLIDKVGNPFHSLLQNFDPNALLYLYCILHIAYFPKGDLSINGQLTIHRVDPTTKKNLSMLIAYMFQDPKIFNSVCDYLNRHIQQQDKTAIMQFSNTIAHGYLAQLSSDTQIWLLCFLKYKVLHLKTYHLSFGDYTPPQNINEQNHIAKLLTLFRFFPDSPVFNSLHKKFPWAKHLSVHLTANRLVAFQKDSAKSLHDVSIPTSVRIFVLFGFINNLNSQNKQWLIKSISLGFFDFRTLSPTARSALLPICLTILATPNIIYSNHEVLNFGKDMKISYANFSNTPITGYNLFLLKKAILEQKTLSTLILNNCALQNDIIPILLNHVICKSNDGFSTLVSIDMTGNHFTLDETNTLFEGFCDAATRQRFLNLTDRQLFFCFHLAYGMQFKEGYLFFANLLANKFFLVNKNKMNPMHTWLIDCISRSELSSGIPYAERELGPYQIRKTAQKELLMMVISLYLLPDLDTKKVILKAINGQSCEPNDIISAIFEQLDFETNEMWAVLGLGLHHQTSLNTLHLETSTTSNYGLPHLLLGLLNGTRLSLTLLDETISIAGAHCLNVLLSEQKLSGLTLEAVSMSVTAAQLAFQNLSQGNLTKLDCSDFLGDEAKAVQQVFDSFCDTSSLLSSSSTALLTRHTAAANGESNSVVTADTEAKHTINTQLRF